MKRCLNTLLLIALFSATALHSCQADSHPPKWIVNTKSSLQTVLLILSEQQLEEQIQLGRTILFINADQFDDEITYPLKLTSPDPTQMVGLEVEGGIRQIRCAAGARVTVQNIVLVAKNELVMPLSIKSIDDVSPFFSPEMLDGEVPLSFVDSEIVLNIDNDEIAFIAASDWMVDLVDQGKAEVISQDDGIVISMIDFEESNISLKNVRIYSEDILPEMQSAIYKELSDIGIESFGRSVTGADEFLQKLEQKPADVSLGDIIEFSSEQLENVVVDWPWGLHVFARGQNERKVIDLSGISAESQGNAVSEIGLDGVVIKESIVERGQLPKSIDCPENLIEEDECLVPILRNPLNIPEDKASCHISAWDATFLVPCAFMRAVKPLLEELVIQTTKSLEQGIQLNPEKAPLVQGSFLQDDDEELSFDIDYMVLDGICIAASKLQCSQEDDELKPIDPNDILARLDALQVGEDDLLDPGLIAAVVIAILLGIMVVVAIVFFKFRSKDVTTVYQDFDPKGAIFVPSHTTWSVTSDTSQAPGNMMAEIQSLVEEIKNKNLVLDIEIGRGAFGVVYKGQWNGEQVAVKVMVFEDRDQLQSKRYKSALLEAAINTSLVHGNVVKCFAYNIEPMAIKDAKSLDPSGKPLPQQGEAAEQSTWEDNPHSALSIGSNAQAISGVYKLSLIQEYCNLGSLTQSIRQQKWWDSSNGWPMLLPVVVLAHSIARGMQHLHHHNLIHGDLKPSNILLKESNSPITKCICKVADFGLSVRLKGDQGVVQNHRAGTPYYVAPEILRNGTLSKKADVFSFGVILWELYNQELVHMNLKRLKSANSAVSKSSSLNNANNNQNSATGAAQTSGKAPSFTGNTPLAYALMTGMCLSPNPDQRPDFDQLVAILHVFKQGVQCGKVAPGEHNRSINKSVAIKVDFRKTEQVLELITLLCNTTDMAQIEVVLDASSDNKAAMGGDRNARQSLEGSGRPIGLGARAKAALSSDRMNTQGSGRFSQDVEGKRKSSDRRRSKEIHSNDGNNSKAAINGSLLYQSFMKEQREAEYKSSDAIPQQRQVFADDHDRFFSIDETTETQFQSANMLSANQVYDQAVGGMQLDVAGDSHMSMQWEGVPKIMKGPGIVGATNTIPEGAVDNGSVSVDLHVLPIDQYL